MELQLRKWCVSFIKTSKRTELQIIYEKELFLKKTAFRIITCVFITLVDWPILCHWFLSASPKKTSENQRLSGAFSGYRKTAVALNG